jgi:hypothetical protein
VFPTAMCFPVGLAVALPNRTKRSPDSIRPTSKRSAARRTRLLKVTELSLDRLWSMAERKEIDDLKTLTLVLMLRTRHPDLFGEMKEQ